MESPKKLYKEAVIFDMDGTLVDNIKYHAIAWAVYLKNKHIDSSSEEIEKGLKSSLKASYVIKPLLKKEINEKEFLSMEDEKEAVYREMYKKGLAGIDGIYPFIDLLKAKDIKIGLATLGNEENAEFTLRALNIRHFFDDIKHGQSVEKRKPDPEIYLKSLEALQIDAKDALVFEDSMPGIFSAHAAGIDVIGIESSHPQKMLVEWGAMDAIPTYADFIRKYDLLKK